MGDGLKVARFLSGNLRMNFLSSPLDSEDSRGIF